MRLFSWNVNGVRAAARSGFLDWLLAEKPDVLCLQETKARTTDLDGAILAPDGYESVWHSAERPGYSGTATYFRKRRRPEAVRALGIDAFDREGRAQVLEYPGFVLINAYYPNSRPERARLAYKLEFCVAMQGLCDSLTGAGRDVIVCGDFNIAHTEIDLARPRDNEDSPGYYVEERTAMGRFLDTGYVDAFRHLVKEPGHYTWWSYRTRARERNVGWRLDYHVVNEGFMKRVREARIHAEVMGSDHCPVSLTVR